MAASIMFGGRDGAGVEMQQTHGIYPEYPTDSTVRWVIYDAVLTGSEPQPRAEHSSAPTDTFMYVFGGQGQDDQPRDDLWRLSSNVTWTQVIPWNQPPSARWGHTAIMDPIGRMLVFGGQTGPGTLATNAVYAYTLSTKAWREVIPANSDPDAAPPARKGHVAVWDPLVREKNGNKKLRMVLFGGESSTGYLNDSWVLERDEGDTTYFWRKLSTQGSPAPRSRAAALYDEQREQFLVIGGDSTYAQAGGQSNVIWALPLRPALVADSAWRSMPAAAPPGGRAGHAVALDGLHFHKNRTPDRFNPHAAPGSQWTPLSWAPKLMPHTYPFLFTLPNNKVFWAGPNGSADWNGEFPALEDSSYILELDPNLTPHGWRRPGIFNRPGDMSGDAGWWGGSAVLYHVDASSSRVMKCGGNHNRGFHEDSADDSTSTYSITINADGTSAGWAKVGLAPDILTHRRDHNLVVLPTGKVLVVGGAGTNFRAKAQLWDPSTGKWSAELAEEPVVRNYHAAAVLLPSAQVLCAGGRPPFGEPDAVGAYRGTIYDPPYLFNTSGGYATRPGIGDVVQRIRYGNDFSICLPSPTTLSSVSLIRPGASTHAFDQNQRYVPLTIKGYSVGNTRVTVSAPADSFVAPPGDYMLFLVNNSGVPSVARWMRVGSEWNQGDATAPATVADLDADAVSSNTIYWVWTVPGDDGASGQPWQHKLVHSSSPITSTSFASSNPVPNLPVPECVGSTQGYTKTGLAACTYYYSAIQVVDESNNHSAIGYSPAIRTLCGGGGGGGASAHEARQEGYGAGLIGAGATPSSSIRPAPTGATVSASTGQAVLVANYESTGGNASWTLFRADPAMLEGSASLDPARIAFQEPDGAAGWRTRKELGDLPADLGLRSFPKSGRVVLPAHYDLASVESRPPGFDLAAASHSRLGELATDTASLSSISLSAGDTLRLRFTPAGTEGERGEDCFFIVRRPLTAGEFGGRRAPGEEKLAARPLAFALHQNLPNPFAKTTMIRFTVPTTSRVRLEVFDLLGRRVRILANAVYAPGEHEIEWDRRSASGSIAQSGLYFYSIEAGSDRSVKRMVVLP